LKQFLHILNMERPRHWGGASKSDLSGLEDHPFGV